MLHKPLHILVTTPASLYNQLTSVKQHTMLATVNTVIVDQIDAAARDKSGSHLALRVEPSDAQIVKRPVRIGPSAKQRPIGGISGFLAGTETSGYPNRVVTPSGSTLVVDVNRRPMKPFWTFRLATG